MKKALILILALSLCLSLCACGGSSSTENPASGNKAEAAPAPVVSEMTDLSEKYSALIDALEAEDYDGALALIKEMKPALPIREVTITTENFLDYFEYAEFPEYNKTTEKDSAGNVVIIRYYSGYYLKDGFVVAEEKQQDCAVEAEVKWKSLYFYKNSGITVGLEDHSYSVSGDPSYTYPYDQTEAGIIFSPVQGGALSCCIPFYPTCLSSGGGNDTHITTDIELVSASGTLYLYE